MKHEDPSWHSNWSRKEPVYLMYVYVCPMYNLLVAALAVRSLGNHPNRVHRVFSCFGRDAVREKAKRHSEARSPARGFQGPANWGFETGPGDGPFGSRLCGGSRQHPGSGCSWVLAMASRVYPLWVTKPITGCGNIWFALPFFIESHAESQLWPFGVQHCTTVVL